MTAEVETLDRWITDKEVRKMLGNISPMTLHRWKSDASLNFPETAKLKNRNLTNYKELHDWIRLQRSLKFIR